MPNPKLSELKEIFQKYSIVKQSDRKIVSKSGDESTWLIDSRNALMRPEALRLAVNIFWEMFEKEYPFQICGQETAALPLIGAIVLKSAGAGKPVNGFFIRKSRKPDGLQKIIEGEINNEKIILIDDLINSGKTISHQIEILKEAGKKVDAVFTLIRYRPLDSYEFLKENGIKAVSLFTLEDFELSLSKKRDEIRTNFEILWRFQSPNPNYFYRVPKSAPVIDDQKLYFGSDSGYFWAIDKKGGSSVWKYKVGWHAKGKSIFSSPALWNNFVYFGSYDGNVYALDKNTGKVKWIFMEADWVGSSPAVAPDLGLVFIGLEFGLWRKRGGIVALDLETGEKKWDFIMSEYTHSSPVYDKKCGVVAIGSNDCKVYLFNAQNGKLLWEFQAGGEIKASLCIDDKRKLLIFGAFDGYIYMLNLSSGELLYKFKTLAAIYSAPVIYENNVIVSSLDKKIYSINMDSKKLDWSFQCGGRAITTPLIVEQSIWVGATDGAMYEIEANSGKLLSIFRTTERITNKPAYDQKSKILFAPTYANEIYAIKI